VVAPKLSTGQPGASFFVRTSQTVTTTTNVAAGLGQVSFGATWNAYGHPIYIGSDIVMG
jgi:hypothetical protein